jgi:glycosyltransferase involved in cell wall biosynthesis
VKDKKLREKTGRNGKRYVAKNHSWESAARKVMEACETVVG